jgi:hypothetical protein
MNSRHQGPFLVQAESRMNRFTRPVKPRFASMHLVLPLLVAGTAVSPVPVQAQDVRYRQVTTTEFAGLMGSAMRMSGEDMGPDTTVNWIKGLKQRVDQADRRASEIFDLETMDMTSWDHVNETYWVLNFQEFMQSADSSMAEARDQLTDEERAQMGAFEPSLEVDRTGETRTINGWEAERVIMTLSLEASTEGMSEEEMEQDPMAAMMGSSSMVMLTELWISDEVPGFGDVLQARGKDAPDFASGTGGMESLAAGYPQMAALTEQLKEEMRGLDGMAIRTTTYTVMAPAGLPFEPDSILEMSDEPLPRGPDLSEIIAQAMANAGEDAAMDAVSNALGGRLGGLLGRRSEPEEEEELEAIQMGGVGGATVISRIVSEIIDVEQLSLSDADFLPPAGYVERDWPGRR